MFAYDNANSQHGTTKGVDSSTLLERFSGTEGPETANKVSTEIKIALGKMNALQFLTTPLSEILAEIPTPDSGMDKFKAFQFKKNLPRSGQKRIGRLEDFQKLGVLSVRR